MQPRHTSPTAVIPLPNPSLGIGTSATFGSNARTINHSYDANGNLTQLTTELITELITSNQTGTARSKS